MSFLPEKKIYIEYWPNIWNTEWVQIRHIYFEQEKHFFFLKNVNLLSEFYNEAFCLNVLGAPKDSSPNLIHLCGDACPL